MYFLTVMRQTFTETMKAGTTFDWGEESRIGVFRQLVSTVEFRWCRPSGAKFLDLLCGSISLVFRHDAHPHYEKIQRNYEKLRARMATRSKKNGKAPERDPKSA